MAEPILDPKGNSARYPTWILALVQATTIAAICELEQRNLQQILEQIQRLRETLIATLQGIVASRHCISELETSICIAAYVVGLISHLQHQPIGNPVQTTLAGYITRYHQTERTLYILNQLEEQINEVITDLLFHGGISTTDT